MRPDQLPDGYFEAVDVEAYQALVRPIVGGTVVEVGVWLGRSLASIAPICADNDTTLYAVDSWERDPKAHMPKVDFDPFERFTANMASRGLLKAYLPLKLPSIKAAQLFDENSVDLVFIDADHEYDSVRADILTWRQKIKRGGTIAGHDYGCEKGVVEAVDEIFGKPRTSGGVWWVKL